MSAAADRCQFEAWGDEVKTNHGVRAATLWSVKCDRPSLVTVQVEYQQDGRKKHRAALVLPGKTWNGKVLSPTALGENCAVSFTENGRSRGTWVINWD